MRPRLPLLVILSVMTAFLGWLLIADRETRSNIAAIEAVTVFIWLLVAYLGARGHARVPSPARVAGGALSGVAATFGLIVVGILAVAIWLMFKMPW